MAEPRLYQSGPNIGKPIQEYPKCLYKGEGEKQETKMVANEDEHRAAEKDGFRAMRGGKYVTLRPVPQGKDKD